MRALDGTYWRVRSNDETIGEYDAIELAYPMASQLSAEYPNISIVRIRPRMSIVRAVRLLTEARKQGVELWMKPANDFANWAWLTVSPAGAFFVTAGDGGHPMNLLVRHVESRWIVATPEDARRIDRRGGK